MYLFSKCNIDTIGLQAMVKVFVGPDTHPLYLYRYKYTIPIGVLVVKGNRKSAEHSRKQKLWGCLRRQPVSSARNASPAGGVCVIGGAVSYYNTKKPALKRTGPCILPLVQCILANRSTAFVKFAMVLSASPCSMPSRTQCLI